MKKKKKFLFALLFLPFIGFSQEVHLVSYTTEFIESSYSMYEVTNVESQVVLINLTPRSVEFLDIDDDYTSSYSLEFFEHEDNVSYYWIDDSPNIFVIDYYTQEIAVLTDFNNETDMFKKIWRFKDLINLTK